MQTPIIPQIDSDEPLFKGISEKTSLPEDVCEGMLRAGWMYFESLVHPPVWKSPAWSIKNKKWEEIAGKPAKIVFMAGEALVVRNYAKEVNPRATPVG